MCFRLRTVLLTKKTEKNLYNKPKRDLQDTRETGRRGLGGAIKVPMLVHDQWFNRLGQCGAL